MTTSLNEWSAFKDFENHLSESDKAYFRAKTRRHVHGVVLEKFSALNAAGDITRSSLADRLGVNRSQITRWLASPGNWTIDTLSDLLLAMACEAKIVADDISDGQVGNYAHPASTIPERKAEIRSPTTQTESVDVKIETLSYSSGRVATKSGSMAA